MITESFELQRLREIKSKYHMECLQIEGHGDRARNVQTSVQDAIDKNEADTTAMTKRYLATASMERNGKLLRLWYEVTPDR